MNVGKNMYPYDTCPRNICKLFWFLFYFMENSMTNKHKQPSFCYLDVRGFRSVVQYNPKKMHSNSKDEVRIK